MSLLNYSPLYPKANFLTYLILQKKKKKYIYIYIYIYIYRERENDTWARVDMEFLFELNTRRQIPYLQATMYYFVYHITTIALY